MGRTSFGIFYGGELPEGISDERFLFIRDRIKKPVLDLAGEGVSVSDRKSVILLGFWLGISGHSGYSPDISGISLSISDIENTPQYKEAVRSWVGVKENCRASASLKQEAVKIGPGKIWIVPCEVA